MAFRITKEKCFSDVFKFSWLLLTQKVSVNEPAKLSYAYGTFNVYHHHQSTSQLIAVRLKSQVERFYCKFHRKAQIDSEIIRLLGDDLVALSREGIEAVIQQMWIMGAREESEYYGELLEKNCSPVMLIYPISYNEEVEKLFKLEGNHQVQYIDEYNNLGGEQVEYFHWEINAYHFDQKHFLNYCAEYAKLSDFKINKQGDRLRISLISNNMQAIKKLGIYFNYQTVIPTLSKYEAVLFKSKREKRRPHQHLQIRQGFFSRQPERILKKQYKRDLGAAIHCGNVAKSETNRYPFICLIFSGPRNVGEAIYKEYQKFEGESSIQSQLSFEPAIAFTQEQTSSHSEQNDSEPDLPVAQVRDYRMNTSEIIAQVGAHEPLEQLSKFEESMKEEKQQQKLIEAIIFHQEKAQFTGTAIFYEQSSLKVDLSLPHLIIRSLNRQDVVNSLQKQVSETVTEMKKDFPTLKTKLIVIEGQSSLKMEIAIKQQTGYILPNCVQHIQQELTKKLAIEKVVEIANLQNTLQGDRFAGRDFFVAAEDGCLWVFGFGIRKRLREIKAEIIENLFPVTFDQLEKDSAEFKLIMKRIAQKNKLKITKVHNPILEQTWSSEKERMEKEKKSGSEQLLFYGTRNVNPIAICRGGFTSPELDPCCDYFSFSEFNQHRQAFSSDATEPQSMKLLLCKVLLGSECQMEDYEELSEDPEKLNRAIAESLEKFDTVSFDLGRNRNFIVKSKKAVCPVYIVTF